jgi:hypothetical protein
MPSGNPNHRFRPIIGFVRPLSLLSLIIGVAAPIFVSSIALADDPKPPVDPSPNPISGAPKTDLDTTATSPTRPPAPSTPIAAAPPPLYLDRSTADAPKSLLLPGILAGTGLALITTGIILAATAPDSPASCNSDTKTCARLPGQTNEDFSNDQERAGRAHTQPVAGWLTVGVGGMLVMAGVLSYVMGDRPERPRVAASVGPSGGHLSLTMRTF